MQRKTLRRFAITAVAAPALAFGAPALASADAYYSYESSGAGPHGAYSYEYGYDRDHGYDHDDGYWHDDDDGHAWYHHSWSHAGPDGAYHYSVSSGSW